MAQVLKAVCCACQRVHFLRRCHVLKRAGMEFKVPVCVSPAVRYTSDKTKAPDLKNDKESEEKPRIPGAAAEKFKIFQDEDSPVILDMYEEEQKRMDAGKAEASGWSKRLPRKSRWQSSNDIPEFVNQEGFLDATLSCSDGVLGIEELTNVLQLENAVNLCVISVPPAMKYVDFIVIVTGKSLRHMRAMAEYIRKLYKTKQNQNDPVPRIEGETSKDWMALDLGNIVLHIFTESARQRFDLETLWAVGPQHDDLANKEEDPVDAMFHEYSLSFQELKFNSDELVSNEDSNEPVSSEDNLSLKDLKFTSAESVNNDNSISVK